MILMWRRRRRGWRRRSRRRRRREHGISLGHLWNGRPTKPTKHIRYDKYVPPPDERL
jgi:hypothetical protein